MSEFDRARALDEHVVHDEDHARNRRRLAGLYGTVARSQNRLIAHCCRGERVLDVGAGYGNLTRQLLDAGKQAIGIEIDHDKIRMAREWFDVDLKFADFRDYDAEAGSFDTIVFREVLNHLDLEMALAKAFRLATRRCLVFQGTEILPLRLAKRLYGHREYDQKTPEGIISGLQQSGFSIREVIYRDALAYPFSGGYAGHALVPSWKYLISMVAAADVFASRMVKAAGLGRHLCFRALIVADKIASEDTRCIAQD